MAQDKGWSRLDNAAKIFPPTSSRRDPRVFRFACELEEPVDPVVLQRALDKTLELFPFYRAVIKKGFFWHYLEDSDLPALVAEETRHPCAALYSGNRRNLLFAVTYYRNRLNLEVYHVLSDGAGAIEFFRAMVLFYLQDKHADELEGPVAKLDYDAAETERYTDSFAKYYKPESIFHTSSLPRSYKIRDDKLPLGQMSVIEGCLSSTQVREAAKHRGATITEFLVALLVVAVGEGMNLRDRRLPVTISVPVNLRQFFPSVSARNFFGMMYITCNLTEDIDFDDVLHQVQEEFKEQLKEENVRTRMNRLAALEHNLAMRVVPLALKDPIMSVAGRMAERQVTASLSNVGRITLPGEVEKYIRLIDVFNSTNQILVLLSSFKDRFMVDFTSVYTSTDVQRRFFRYLTNLGLSCEISTNWVDEKGNGNVL